MICLYRMGKKRPQLIYLISLSCCEALLNFQRLLTTLIPRVILIVDEESNITEAIQHYFNIAIFSGLCFIYYCSMMSVIFDRFLGIFLSLKYKAYCTTFKAKVVVPTLWMIGFVLIFTLPLIDVLTKFHIDLGIIWYVYPCFDLSVIVLSIVTYLYIFKRYKSSQSRTSSTSIESRAHSLSSANLFKNSKFFIPLLLTITFAIFIAVPDLSFFIIEINKKKYPALHVALRLCYPLSDLADAFIYLYLQPSVRRLLWKKLQMLFHRASVMLVVSESQL